MPLEQRYENPEINRQFWLAQALIQIKSYKWGDVDTVAAECSDDEVAAFLAIINKLNSK